MNHYKYSLHDLNQALQTIDAYDPNIVEEKLKEKAFLHFQFPLELQMN
jgi:hypothetical protein